MLSVMIWLDGVVFRHKGNFIYTCYTCIWRLVWYNNCFLNYLCQQHVPFVLSWYHILFIPWNIVTYSRYAGRPRPSTAVMWPCFLLWCNRPVQDTPSPPAVFLHAVTKSAEPSRAEARWLLRNSKQLLAALPNNTGWAAPTSSVLKQILEPFVWYWRTYFIVMCMFLIFGWRHDYHGQVCQCSGEIGSVYCSL
jgi:hypothetical protein